MSIMNYTIRRSKKKDNNF